MDKTIRILIADDHTVVRHGLRLMLELKPGIEVIGEAATGDEAIALADRLRPDVILMDLEMPGKSGLEAITQIHPRHPEIRILVLTSFVDSEKIASAIKNGAAGYLHKDSSPSELIHPRSGSEKYQPVAGVNSKAGRRASTSIGSIEKRC